jgi:hypothetical protein
MALPNRMSLRPGLLWLTVNLALIILCLSWNNVFIFLNFTYPLRCLCVPPGVRVPQVEYHWCNKYRVFPKNSSQLVLFNGDCLLWGRSWTFIHWQFILTSGLKRLTPPSVIRNIASLKSSLLHSPRTPIKKQSEVGTYSSWSGCSSVCQQKC